MARFLGSTYVLESRIGVGDTGEVWRGRSVDGTPLAFKLFHPAIARNPVVVRRLLLGRSTLAGIVHPNVVRVHDIVAEAESLCVVMDLVRGEDLARARARHGIFAPRVVARIGSALASGLRAVHEAGLVHADVKLSNVLLDMSVAPAVPRLADAGVAEVVAAAAASRRTGAPTDAAGIRPDGLGAYGCRDHAQASDLVALGRLLQELCADADPTTDRGSTRSGDLAGDDLAGAGGAGANPDRGGARNAATGQPERLDALVAVIARLVDPDPGNRFARAEEVSAALDEVGRVLATPREENSPASPTRSTPRFGPFAWRRTSSDG